MNNTYTSTIHAFHFHAHQDHTSFPEFCEQHEAIHPNTSVIIRISPNNPDYIDLIRIKDRVIESVEPFQYGYWLVSTNDGIMPMTEKMFHALFQPADNPPINPSTRTPPMNTSTPTPPPYAPNPILITYVESYGRKHGRHRRTR
ncbi:MAG: hypothetical protein ACYCV4_01995 [Dermatophilaceae bacterium]